MRRSLLPKIPSKASINLGAPHFHVSTFPRFVVGMEACTSAHFVSRMLRELGFEPRIIPAIYVKPFNKGQKNDCNYEETWACGPSLPFPSLPSRSRVLATWRGLVKSVKKGVRSRSQKHTFRVRFGRAGIQVTVRNPLLLRYLAIVEIGFPPKTV